MKKPKQYEPLWDKKKVMEYLGIKKSKLWELTATGEIPTVRIGRSLKFLPEDVYKWAKKKAS